MRSIWNGSLSFGLVTIPVKLYGATEDHDIAFHQVHAADGGRIRYQRICEVCGEKVEFRDIAKAYDTDDGETVMLTDEDFATLPADRSREISVQEFVPSDQIDPLLFDKSYFVEPAPAAAKAYVLLRRTLESTDRVAVVRFALRQRTQLAALRVHGDLLAVQALRWPDEIREMEVPEKVSAATVTDRELTMASTLVDSYSTDFTPEEFTDDYQVQMRALIEAKLEGGQAFPTEEKAAEGEDAEVLDLLAALERSVARRERGSAASDDADQADDTDSGSKSGTAASKGSRSRTSGGATGTTRRKTASGSGSSTRSTGTKGRTAGSSDSGSDDDEVEEKAATGTEPHARTTKSRRRA
jgi:DNA end-binding protein Ku